MATLTLAEQREKLIARITSLKSKVTDGDKTTEYDLSTAQNAIKVIDREIQNTPGVTKRTQNIRFKPTGKDL